MRILIHMSFFQFSVSYAYMLLVINALVDVEYEPRVYSTQYERSSVDSSRSFCFYTFIFWRLFSFYFILTCPLNTKLGNLKIDSYFN